METMTVAEGEPQVYWHLTFVTTPGGCHVYVSNNGGFKMTSPGETGSCTYTLPQGYYSYSVWKTGYKTETGNVHLTEDTTITLVMVPDYVGSEIDGEMFMPPGPIPYGMFIEGSIHVYNIGSSGSYLDWGITDWPIWGTGWLFNPAFGVDVSTTDEAISIVTFYAPEIPGQYQGCIVVANAHYPLTDYVELPYIVKVNLEADGKYYVEIIILEAIVHHQNP